MLLALTDQWQTAGELAEVAGIPVKGAGTVLLALHNQRLAERRDGGDFDAEGEGSEGRRPARTGPIGRRSFASATTRMRSSPR
jgi:hypothetical protein